MYKVWQVPHKHEIWQLLNSIIKIISEREIEIRVQE